MTEYAIFDTETDRFWTSNWSENMCYKILKLWQSRHPELNMERFELRPRYYDNEIDNSAILIISKLHNNIIAFYHWQSRKYALAYNKNDVFFVKYNPPQEHDITDILSRFDNNQWDNKGTIIDLSEL